MTPLEETLSEYSDGHLLIIEPGGNHGDTMIYEGLEKALNRLGVPHTVMRCRSRPGAAYGHLQLAYHAFSPMSPVDAVYIHGGGNFNDMWGVGIHFFKVVTRLFDCPIIVGPQTVHFDETDPEDIFGEIENDVMFFCREKYSRDVLDPVFKSHENLSLGLSPDTALYLDSADFDYWLGGGEYTLLSFRGDKESAGSEVRSQLNIDGPVRESDISVEADSLNEFMEAVAKASYVYTDRLHVGIAAAVLGRPVTLYDNSYYKNRGVYEYSLSEYDCVSFEALR